MIAVTTRPDRAHKEEASAVSRYVCSRHPIFYSFTRQDWPVINITNQGGFAAFLVDGDLDSVEDVQVGDQLYYSQYNISCNVTAVVPVVDDIYYITDAPFSAFTGGYLVHLSRPAHRIEVEVMLIDPITGLSTSVGVTKVTTNNKGVGSVDISSMVNAYIEKKNLFTYDAINWRDDKVFSLFYIKYQEKWKDVEQTQVTDIVSTYIPLLDIYVDAIATYTAVDATKYLLADYGQNLCDYYLHAIDGLTEKAKFLSDFTTPTYFPGYPFDLAFCYPFLISSLEMSKGEDKFDVTGSLLSSSLSTILRPQAGGVNRLTLAGGYPSGASYVEVYLKGNSILSDGYYVTGYIEDGYYTIAESTALTPYEITERKRVKIFNGCADNPFYLSWRGTKGNWNYWLFNLNQQHNITSKPEGEYSTEPDDLEAASSRKKYASISQVERVKLYTRIPVSDLRGLSTIEGSPCVQWLYNPDLLTTEPERAWMTVRMVPKGFSYQTKASFVEVELEIELPELYTVPN